jgi:exonuclease III
MAYTCFDYSLLAWNVWGLNNPAKQEDVKQVIQLHKLMIICLQETKLREITNLMVNIYLGPDYSANLWYLPVEGTRGGVLLACRGTSLKFSDVSINTYTISIKVWDNRTHIAWSLTDVYGPQLDLDKRLFL